jgi:hypothetical protein
LILLANLAPALFLAGIASFLQFVQLPLLRDSADFSHYIRDHRFRNTLLMSLPMLIELIAAVLLFLQSRSAAATLLLAALLAVWLVTFLGIVPSFRRLTHGYDSITVNRLITWNGVRTLCWTARSGALLYIVAKGLRVGST